MKFGTSFRFSTLAELAQAMGGLASAVAAGWNVEHGPDGRHATIRPTRVQYRGAVIDEASAILTPDQLTANTDNYNPSGWRVARVIRLSASGAINLTGWVAPSPDVAQSLQVLNVGAQTITFIHASGSSATANQFRIGGLADQDLLAGDRMDLWRDPALQVWSVR